MSTTTLDLFLSLSRYPFTRGLGYVILLVEYQRSTKSKSLRARRKYVTVPARDVLSEMAKIAADPKVNRIVGDRGYPLPWTYVAARSVAA